MIIECTLKESEKSCLITTIKGNALSINVIKPPVNYIHPTFLNDDPEKSIINTPLTIVFHRQESIDRLIAVLKLIKPE